MDALATGHAMPFYSTVMAPFDEQASVVGNVSAHRQNLKQCTKLCGISCIEICCTQNLVTSDTDAHHGSLVGSGMGAYIACAQLCTVRSSLGVPSIGINLVASTFCVSGKDRRTGAINLGSSSPT